MSASSVAAPPRPVALDALGAFPDLFVDYCTDYGAVADSYAGNPYAPEARRAAADRAAEHDRDRDALADVLVDQNKQWGLDAATAAHIEALRDPEAVAVVTGQQVGLLTGPLYTIYKTITTLKLAERLADETDRPVVPMFWVEGEDHDFAEIATTHLLHRNELVGVTYDNGVAANGNPGAVGRIALSERVQDVLTAVDEALPPSDFKPAVMEQVEAAYRPGTTLEDAFAQLMRRLFPEAGLVFVNPDDRRLKAMAAPLFRQEIDAPSTTSAHVNEAGDRLEAAGYHAQVHARPTNLFLLDDDGRYPIDTDGDGGFALRGTDRTFSADALHDLLDTAPERLSPNVVLRPLMQDALLPTAAYVAGPSEVSYFAQYRAVYDAMDVPMPVIYPRASVSLVEGKVQKVLDKYDLSLPDVAGHLDQLFQDVVKAEMEVDVDEVFGDAMREIHQAVNDLKPDVEAVDRSLTPAVEATRTDLQQAMDALKTRVVKAEKRAQDEVRAQLEKARVNLVPGGTLQERVVSVLYFLNKYSLDLLDDLRDGLTLDTSAHQVVEL